MFQGVVRGRWLWTGQALLERGGVAVRGGRVEALLAAGDPDPAGLEVLDLPRALVHPAFLNAHAHLDLSGLEGAVPRGLPFPGWLERVRRHRLEAGEEALAAAACAGVESLVREGVSAVVDFAHGGLSEPALRAGGLRAAVLREVIGPDPARAAAAAAAAGEWLRTRPAAPLLAHGLAPHSAYLATAELIRECRRLSEGRPFSIHAAEFPGESLYLREGRGDLPRLLEEAGVDLGRVRCPGVGPLEHLERLGILPGALLVHAAHLEAGDLERVARGGAAVVFCPRSHRYFDRPPHPLPDLLAAGVPAALGTDSAASGGRLSISEEMREARRAFPGLPARALFALGTGALLEGRGFVPWKGTLRLGEPADLAAAEVPAGAGDPLEGFLAGGGPNLLTLAAGRLLFSA